MSGVRYCRWDDFSIQLVTYVYACVVFFGFFFAYCISGVARFVVCLS